MAGLSQIYADGFARDLIPRSTAPTFLSSTSYAVGDYVYYQGSLYRCTTAHTGTWVASHFTAVTVGSELKAKEASLQSEIDDVKSDLNDLEEEIKEHGGLSDEAKTALLNCFAHVAWTDEHGQDYYDALEASLYNDYPKITATFNSGTNVIYTDDSLDTLKQYLTVKYYASKSSTGETIPATDYTLFGQLSEGDNTVGVEYGEYRATFIVNAVDFYNIMEWSTPTSLKSMRVVPGFHNNTCGYGVQAVDIRASIWAYRGKKGAYNNNESAFDNTSYPIPIPSSATKMSIVCNNLSNVYAGVSLWKYNPTTETYTRNVNGAWTPITGTKFDVDRSTNDFVTIAFKISSSSGEVFPEDPNVTVTFE